MASTSNRLAAHPAEPRPMADLNTTPLIDVLLVLLILLIITIPVSTNSTEVDLGACGGNCPAIERDQNEHVVTPGNRVLWNGSEVTMPQLSALLVRSRAIAPEPELRFAPDGAASYAMTLDVIARIKAAEVTNFGFVGNERFEGFSKSATR